VSLRIIIDKKCNSHSKNGFEYKYLFKNKMIKGKGNEAK